MLQSRVHLCHLEPNLQLNFLNKFRPRVLIQEHQNNLDSFITAATEKNSSPKMAHFHLNELPSSPPCLALWISKVQEVGQTQWLIVNLLKFLLLLSPPSPTWLELRTSHSSEIWSLGSRDNECWAPPANERLEKTFFLLLKQVRDGVEASWTH